MFGANNWHCVIELSDIEKLAHLESSIFFVNNESFQRRDTFVVRNVENLSQIQILKNELHYKNIIIEFTLLEKVEWKI